MALPIFYIHETLLQQTNAKIRNCARCDNLITGERSFIFSRRHFGAAV